VADVFEGDAVEAVCLTFFTRNRTLPASRCFNWFSRFSPKLNFLVKPFESLLAITSRLIWPNPIRYGDAIHVTDYQSQNRLWETFSDSP
jgi:hypothetical protein